MQTETPGLVDLLGRDACDASICLHGIGQAPDRSPRPGSPCQPAGLSEAGVRFVQVTISGWDHHGNIRDALPKSCAASDRPVAGLIKDLKSAAGLLDDTLVVWSGEFGRTPWSQDLSGTAPIDTTEARASARRVSAPGSPAVV